MVDLGVSKVTAAGEIFNLRKLSDFSGNYVATARPEPRWVAALGPIPMKNQHGGGHEAGRERERVCS